MSKRLDEIDAKILELLQRKGRMKRSDVADEVDLSISEIGRASCRERV